MHSSFIIAAFAAGALAVPYNKREIITDVEMVVVTDIITVTATAGQAPPAAPTDDAAQPAAHWGRPGGWGGSWTWSHDAPAATTEEATSTWVAPAPTSTSETPVYVAPTTSTSTWIAPTTSSEAAPITFVAPTTSTSSEAAPVTQASAPATSSAASGGWSVASPPPPTYSDITVFHHNVHRQNYTDTPDLVWNQSLADSAQTIAQSCVYAHNTDVAGGGYGQNIAAGVQAENISVIISDLFYNGEVNWFAGLYGQANPSANFENWGHFSQIVWRDTQSVGCYTQYCPSGLGNTGSGVSPYFTVCNYYPAGNYGGEYAANIGNSLNLPTVQGDISVVSGDAQSM